MAEEALVDRDADPGTVDLTVTGLAPQLPGELADLGQAGDRQVDGAQVGITANQGLFGHGSSVILTR